MVNAICVSSILASTFKILKILLIAPYTHNFELSHASVLCTFLSILSLAVVSIWYVLSFKQFDAEWYSNSEHFWIDVVVTVVWYIMFVICVVTPVIKYRTLKAIVTRIQKVHNSLVELKIFPRYRSCWLKIRLFSRLMLILGFILLTYLQIEYYDDFRLSFMNLLAYIPMLIICAVNTEVITLMSIIDSQFKVIIIKLRQVGKSNLKQKVLIIENLIILQNKVSNVCILSGKYFEPQLIIFVVHVFVRVTSNLYYAIFTTTVNKDSDGFALNCSIWAVWDMIELWRVLVALSTLIKNVEQFYYTIYDLAIEDRNFMLTFSPRVNLFLEKRFQLQFLLGGLLEFNLPLLPTIFGAVFTNLVLSIQFQKRIRL